MLNEQKPGELGNIGRYLPATMKFYELKDEKLTPAVFMVILLLSFGGSYIPGLLGLSSIGYTVFYMVNLLIMQLIYSVYICAFIRDLKGESYTIADCIRRVYGSVAKIIFASIIFVTCVFLGVVLFFIPAIIISLMFMFYICYIVDKDLSIPDVFRASKQATDGKKWDLFKILFIFSIVTVLPLSVITMISYSSNNQLAFGFVVSFAGAVISIMQQRLMTLMYVDIEYGQKGNM